MDHDQRFKAMLREFFADFLRLFFPDWAACFDLSRPEWLDKEVLPDPPEGERHLLDLVARLQTTRPLGDPAAPPEEWLALVHVEVEAADRTTLLKPRLPLYYLHLRQSQGRPVLPIVLYLNVGLDGVGVDTVEEFVGGFNVLTFRYHYVGLPALDAVQYAGGDNWLGVGLSALMNGPRERWPELGATALLRLADAPLTEQQRFLLSDCINAYLPLDEEGRRLFERITMATPFSKLVPRNKTPYDKGMEAGARDLAVALLESRFRTVPEAVVTKLEGMDLAQLRELAPKIPAAASLDELFPAAA